ncbi:MAG TPA: sigma-70 family RNA polymerase sigma factor [Pyrinomonadaceae bacterium]|jgi:RNA polymerase sigma-70 factor (ECF subfamily)|nr:sigma-70 family RNA polymerase sigma factor [Pyrinomonadaceae bacterium]
MTITRANIVSRTAAELRPITDLTDFSENLAMNELAAGNAAIEDLGALFREHYKGMFRVAYRITGSETDSEDVLQTIFVRLTPGWSERDLSPNPRAFLYRAAINASLDIVRSRKRANAVSLDVVDYEQSSPMGNPADHLADKELRELIRHAVAKLEGRAATAFVLRYYEGYDNRRIAETLGTSQMVVAVTLHRARTRLRKEIGNYLEKYHEA